MLLNYRHLIREALSSPELGVGCSEANNDEDGRALDVMTTRLFLKSCRLAMSGRLSAP